MARIVFTIGQLTTRLIAATLVICALTPFSARAGTVLYSNITTDTGDTLEYAATASGSCPTVQ